MLATLPFLGFPAFAQEAGSADRLLTDFSGESTTMRWRSVNDGVMGGLSSGSFRIVDGVLEFSGSLNTNGGGFASIRTDQRPLRLGDAQGIHLRVRGDGREYTMLLRQRGSEGRRAVSYRSTFRAGKSKAWQDVWLPFETFVPTWRGRTLDLPALEARRIDGLGLMIGDKVDGPFRLEVDSIRAYAPFALQHQQGRFRPVVVLAPSASDRRLKDQLAAIRATKSDFVDREMLLIVVLQKGASLAGTRNLTPTEAGRLRRRFGVAPDAFGVKLVGKDGGVKRSADAPIDPEVLYRLIDKMPMRRAEIAARKRAK